MSNDPANFRDRLFKSQEVTPALRAAYDKERDAILHEVPSRKNRFLAIVLLLIMLAVVAGEVRALIVYRGGFTFYVGAVTMLIVCAVVSAWLIRDLRKSKVAKKSAHQVSELFYGAASILTVVSLIHGLGCRPIPVRRLTRFSFLCSCSSARCGRLPIELPHPKWR